ncbi:c-type cytochrome domain-containing protein [Pontiella agarivorans]|uniref:Cytochrome c domain-containing protein n=1 Tax=Pontiella agarivorans TaxID=3038953 RepID=A0ABU5N106_9BACT|nr:c-type cytochrome domain-containing protein [Pontiella agarivorans]MDZ8119921.1 hypothetical protein [Pontiella agarivorans]
MIGKISAVVFGLAVLSASAAEVSLEKDLMPLFQRSCGTCHAPDSGIRGAIKNGAYFNEKKDLLGKVGGAVVAGNPEKSGLVKVLAQEVTFGKRALVMPPPKSGVPAFSKEEIEKIKAWINAGAKDN